MRHLVLAAVLAAPVPALAHAVLIQSDPSDHGTLKAGTHEVMFRYNSRIDLGRSRLTLKGTNAEMVLPLAPSSAPDVLKSTVDVSPGRYVIRWQVLAVDGHMTRGDVHFTVTSK